METKKSVIFGFIVNRRLALENLKAATALKKIRANNAPETGWHVLEVTDNNSLKKTCQYYQ